MTQTRKKYIKQVRRRLNMPRELKNRVINDLVSSIHERMEDGTPEEAVLQDLGSPAAVAAEFNEQMKEFTYRKSPWRFLFLAAAILSGAGMLFTLFFQMLLNDLFSRSTMASIGIIGGADGPTSVFISAAPGYEITSLLPYLLGLVIGIGGFVFFSRRNRNAER